MTTVVTGATGHVGGNLVRALLTEGRTVRVLVRQDDPPALRGLSVERVGGDVRDPDSLTRAFVGCEVLYHAAAVISIIGGQRGLVHAVNVEGARNVAEAAVDAGVRRMVHFSSVHAFQQSPLHVPLDENRARVASRGAPAYDRSKAAGEAAVREVIRRRRLDAVIVHPAAVLGRHDYRPSRMGQVFLDLFHRKLPALIDGGFDWVDVRDVVQGAMAAESRGRCGESYLLSGHWRSIRELAEVVERVVGVPAPRMTTPMWLARCVAPVSELAGRLMGREPLFTPESLCALRANRVYVRDKAAGELGHEPRPLEETVRDVYRFFLESGRIKNSPEVAERLQSET